MASASTSSRGTRVKIVKVRGKASVSTCDRGAGVKNVMAAAYASTRKRRGSVRNVRDGGGFAERAKEW